MDGEMSLLVQDEIPGTQNFDFVPEDYFVYDIKRDDDYLYLLIGDSQREKTWLLIRNVESSVPVEYIYTSRSPGDPVQICILEHDDYKNYFLWSIGNNQSVSYIFLSGLTIDNGGCLFNYVDNGRNHFYFVIYRNLFVGYYYRTSQDLTDLFHIYSTWAFWFSTSSGVYCSFYAASDFSDSQQKFSQYTYNGGGEFTKTDITFNPVGGSVEYNVIGSVKYFDSPNIEVFGFSRSGVRRALVSLVYNWLGGGSVKSNILGYFDVTFLNPNFEDPNWLGMIMTSIQSNNQVTSLILKLGLFHAGYNYYNSLGVTLLPNVHQNNPRVFFDETNKNEDVFIPRPMYNFSDNTYNIVNPAVAEVNSSQIYSGEFIERCDVEKIDENQIFSIVGSRGCYLGYGNNSKFIKMIPFSGSTGFFRETMYYAIQMFGYFGTYFNNFVLTKFVETGYFTKILLSRPLFNISYTANLSSIAVVATCENDIENNKFVYIYHLFPLCVQRSKKSFDTGLCEISTFFNVDGINEKINRDYAGEFSPLLGNGANVGVVIDLLPRDIDINPLFDTYYRNKTDFQPQTKRYFNLEDTTIIDFLRLLAITNTNSFGFINEQGQFFEREIKYFDTYFTYATVSFSDSWTGCDYEFYDVIDRRVQGVERYNWVQIIVSDRDNPLSDAFMVEGPIYTDEIIKKSLIINISWLENLIVPHDTTRLTNPAEVGLNNIIETLKIFNWKKYFFKIVEMKKRLHIGDLIQFVENPNLTDGDGMGIITEIVFENGVWAITATNPLYVMDFFDLNTIRMNQNKLERLGKMQKGRSYAVRNLTSNKEEIYHRVEGKYTISSEQIVINPTTFLNGVPTLLSERFLFDKYSTRLNLSTPNNPLRIRTPNLLEICANSGDVANINFCDQSGQQGIYMKNIGSGGNNQFLPASAGYIGIPSKHWYSAHIDHIYSLGPVVYDFVDDILTAASLDTRDSKKLLSSFKNKIKKYRPDLKKRQKEGEELQVEETETSSSDLWDFAVSCVVKLSRKVIELEAKILAMEAGKK